jgi:D-3-phosphoglycerate dehydrogenase
MPQLTQNLIRLDASSYHGEDFIRNEQLIAEELGLRYFFGLEDFNKLKEVIHHNSFIFISNTHSRPEEVPLEVRRQTKLWIHSNSGYDNFNTSFVKSVDFPIITGNPIRSSAVTEYILAQVFERFTFINHHSSWDKSRAWPRELLSEKRMLICGAGIIGKSLYQSLTPLTKEVLIYDPHKVSGQNRDFNKFLAQAPEFDIVLLACSLNSTSRMLINKESLELFNQNFFIVNAARGGLLDEKALHAHLLQNENAAAVLDVFEQEPTPSDYFDLKNLKRTSHVAGVSKNLDQQIISYETEVLTHFLKRYSSFMETYKNLLLANRIDSTNQELI